MRLAKTLARQVLPKPAFETLKAVQRRVAFLKKSGFSEEEGTIRRYLEALPLTNKYCVDIGAQDGVSGSQTAALFKNGWTGIAVEGDPAMFAVLSRLYHGLRSVHLARALVSPDNVVSLLTSYSCPEDFSFLSLDIDGYDYFVLEQILASFRPRLICVEINETIPPPLVFTVKFDPQHAWRGDHFQGQSICKCHELCVRHGYDIVELLYNNLFIVPREINSYRALRPEEAYDAGYRNRPDRAAKFPWNVDMEAVLTMSRLEAIDFLNDKFARYAGQYVLE